MEKDVMPASPLIDAALEAPSLTLEEIEARIEQLDSQKAKEVDTFKATISELQKKADKISQAHNKSLASINTKRVELQGARKLLTGDL